MTIRVIEFCSFAHNDIHGHARDHVERLSEGFRINQVGNEKFDHLMFLDEHILGAGIKNTSCDHILHIALQNGNCDSETVVGSFKFS